MFRKERTECHPGVLLNASLCPCLIQPRWAVYLSCYPSRCFLESPEKQEKKVNPFIFNNFTQDPFILNSQPTFSSRNFL